METCKSNDCQHYGRKGHCQCTGGEYDLCVLCGAETQYTKDTHVDMRIGYIDGAGQLCVDCFGKQIKDIVEYELPTPEIIAYQNKKLDELSKSLYLALDEIKNKQK